ncbi:hypothetical protein CANCADRAFT_3901 [Tortispora caseinolytica NRRL Y-17796]|uniref:Enoyl reductase (ER) domain-containing protein n=1 Tax=Tortispora caseinolytica NRRL Y-17796 TaxID=767744 RepID=A0A1E4TBY2_9ASCO|nr:hypothetical protein CANCADRAFT_3901 [Tortispora caseinolytica NRRL Y-17796]
MSMSHLVLQERPEGEITETTFKKVSESLPETLKKGQVLVKVTYVSVDPAMRGSLEDVRSYLPPIPIGGSMWAAGLGEVIKSENADFPVGEIVRGNYGFADHFLSQDGSDLEKLSFKDVDIPQYLALFGITGLTAYIGLMKLIDPQPGQTIVVSGAAGAVGSIVCQIAKLKGARVVGIAGTPEKVRWLLNDLKVDAALNYKSPDYEKEFVEATKDLIDGYFDNVGGKTLDLALQQVKPHARFAICGSISGYNGKVEPLYNYMNIVKFSLKIEGFIILEHQADFPKAVSDLSTWLKEGKIISRVDIIDGKVEELPRALAGLFKGTNTGKRIVKLKV